MSGIQHQVLGAELMKIVLKYEISITINGMVLNQF